MTLDTVLATVALVGAVVAALSARLRLLPLSEPLLGLVVGAVLGGAVSGLLPLPTVLADHALLHEASRLLLAVSVMSVALRYPLTEVRKRLGPVTLLILVAMPAMAALSGGLAWLLLEIPVAAAVLLGAAVCPTDPVLASSVVTGEPAERDVPARDRQILSVESGANDGLAVPLVLGAIALAGPLTATTALVETAWQILGGVALGLAAGWLSARAMRLGEEHGATDPASVLMFTVVLAVGVLGAAGLLGVGGILAVFVAGLAFNHGSTGSDRAGAVSIDEAVNRFAVLPVFVLLGAMLPWDAWVDLGWQGAVLAVSILLLRRLPVLFALRRPLGLTAPEAAYLGWFGPVGVSALFYLTLEADRLGANETVLAVGALIVAASTVAHGATSSLGRRLYHRASMARGPRDRVEPG